MATDEQLNRDLSIIRDSATEDTGSVGTPIAIMREVRVRVASNPSSATIFVNSENIGALTNSIITVKLAYGGSASIYVDKSGYKRSIISKLTWEGGFIVVETSGVKTQYEPEDVVFLDFKLIALNTDPIEPTDDVVVNHTIRFDTRFPIVRQVKLDNTTLSIANAYGVRHSRTIKLLPVQYDGIQFSKWITYPDINDTTAILLRLEQIENELAEINLSDAQNETEIRLLLTEKANLELELEKAEELYQSKAKEYTTEELTLTVTENLIIELVYESLEAKPTISGVPESITNEVTPSATSVSFKLPYQAENAERILVSSKFGTKEYNNGDDIELEFFRDFNGQVGVYVLAVYAHSTVTNEYARIDTTVTFKNAIETPTISKIKYPEQIQVPSFANDFVEFEVTWESIETTKVVLKAGALSVELPPNGTTKINFQDLRSDYGVIDFKLIPYKSDTTGETIVFPIEFIEPDRKITKESAISIFIDTYSKLYEQEIFDEYDRIYDEEKYLRNVMNFGNDEQYLITSWDADNISFPNDINDVSKNGSVILKLYEPLPSGIEVNDRLWISKEVTAPVIRQIIFDTQGATVCEFIQPANFNIEVEGIDGRDTGFQNYDELLASGSTTNQTLVDEFIEKSIIDTKLLQIDYTDFANFVYYGSAKERLVNFKYKKELEEFYDAKINEIVAATASFESPTVKQEKEAWQNKKDTLINNFDSYERHLYYTTGSDLTTWPKSGSVNYHTTASDSIAWYASQSAVAEEYDSQNPNWLNNNLPSHIVNDTQNAEYLLFSSMVGHHFDIIWAYVKAFENLKVVEHKRDIGIPDGLLSFMLSSFGWTPKHSTSIKDLWDFAFGTLSNGNVLSAASANDRNSQIWRRILNNLPYLLKNKGTKRGIQALITCYGIPASILSIREYGGPSISVSGSEYTFESNTFGLVFTSGSTLEVPISSSDLGRNPDAFEVVFRLDNTGSYNLVVSDYVTVDTTYVSGSFGKMSFMISGSIEYSSSTGDIPIYSGDVYSLLVNRNNSDESVDYYLKNSDEFGINQQYSASITVSASNWDSLTSITLGNNFEGLLDEFRLWKTPLLESVFNQHVTYHDSYVGNSVSASVNDLLFRLSFESASNLGAATPSYVTSIAEVTYPTEATASFFTSSTDYPHNYENFTRVNIAKLPNMGLSQPNNNKIRLESQQLVTNLSYKHRATVKSLDQAPIDSNRLGVFFSPTDGTNLDIIKSIGDFDFNDYIGDPWDRYESTYQSLVEIRDIYWNRFSTNPPDAWDYIKLIKNFDRTLFDYIEELVPARAKLATGLLIEPHILERAKLKFDKPSIEDVSNETSISIAPTPESEYIGITSSVDVDSEVALTGDVPYYTSSADASDITLTSTYPYYTSSVDVDNDVDLSESEFLSHTSSVDLELYTGNLEYQTRLNRITFGFDKYDDASVQGMYIMSGGYTELLTLDEGKIVGERVKVQAFTETVIETIPVLPSGSDPADTPTLTQVSSSETHYTILPVDSTASVGDPVTGYVDNHYKYTSAKTTGLQESYYEGSKQTVDTTIDKSEPVETFISNPNKLRVNRSGRDSSEPILEVDE